MDTNNLKLELIRLVLDTTDMDLLETLRDTLNTARKIVNSKTEPAILSQEEIEQRLNEIAEGRQFTDAEMMRRIREVLETASA